MGSLLDRTGVLVVDDDNDTREALAELLGFYGASVRTAIDARRALEIVHAWRPDIFLIDLGLPRVDGCQLVETFHGMPALHDVPAVAVTGYVFTRHKERADAAGFNAYLTKPFDVDEMLALVSRLAGERRAGR